MTLRLLIPGARSLKDRRRPVRSIKDRLRSRYNLSVAEVDSQEFPQSAVLAVAGVSNDRAVVEGLLDQAAAWVRSSRQVDVTACEKEFL